MQKASMFHLRQVQPLYLIKKEAGGSLYGNASCGYDRQRRHQDLPRGFRQRYPLGSMELQEIVNSGKPGRLQSMGSQRGGRGLVTEQQPQQGCSGCK